MITFRKRQANNQIITSKKIQDIFSNWTKKECWLFVAPHDDDIAIGAGNTVIAGIESGVEVHCAITADGSMGYCTPEHKESISEIRKKECLESFNTLGVKNIHFLNFPDCALPLYKGRSFKTTGHPSEIANAAGLQNSYVHLIRKINPTRVFIPTQTDLHPDHQTVNSEFLISVFHAEGGIWPELGERIPAIPTIYEYAVYTDFIQHPQLCIEISGELHKRKQKSLWAYASQTQVEERMNTLSGSFEFIREVNFDFYTPEKYLVDFLK